MEDIDEIKDFIQENKPIFKDWEKYIKSVDWSEMMVTKTYAAEVGDIKKVYKYYEERDKEFRVQTGVVNNILLRLTRFIKKEKKDYKNPEFKRFYKYSLGIINTHIKRYNTYFSNCKFSECFDGQKEIEYQETIHSSISKIKDELKTISFVEDDEKPKDLIEFYEDKKASLAVYKEVMRDFPFVRKKIESMKIDFDSPPPPTLHILNEKPPIWDSEKNFWEQEKGTIQYYIDELKKIEYGIEIDGYFFDGWLYFHINHFVTPIPHTITINGVEENEDRIIVPPLRDNEIIMTDYFIKAKNDQGYALVAATRRAAKTTLNASRVERAKLIGRRQILVAGGSPKDLGQIEDNCRVYDDNCNPSFKLYFLGEDDKGGKEYGIRTKDNKRKRHTTAYFINLEAGVKKTKTEILAGFTPDEFILDEAFKFHFASQLEGLEPALFGQGVMRCFPLITATGGDDDLAADGIKMLNHPEDNKVTLMDWEKFEERVPEQYRTWNKKPFGLFLPGQMSTRFGEKMYIPFNDYLGIEKEDAPTLSKLKIGVTDWENTTKKIHQEREEKASDKRKYIKFLAYHPLTPEDIFMSGKENPFPVQEAKAHRRYLEETGLWDARKEVYKDTTGKIKIEPSKRELIPYPFKGIADAPFLIFEVPPPKDQIPYGMYTSGFDDYKQDDSDTDSVATFYVWKNIMLGDKWSKRIVASLSIRPDKHREVWEKWLLLMELYNLMQTAFGENEDFRIKDFLESRKLADYYLAPNLNFTQSFTITNNRKRDFGWTPRTTKKFLMDLFIDYCNEEHEVELEDGSIKIYKGVQLIDDIYLLDEIINYNEHANVDRIIGAIGGLGYIHYLNASRSWNSSKNYKKNIEEEQQVQRTFQKSFYANNLRGTYGNVRKRR